jgi:hypothetical protein
MSPVAVHVEVPLPVLVEVHHWGASKFGESSRRPAGRLSLQGDPAGYSDCITRPHDHGVDASGRHGRQQQLRTRGEQPAPVWPLSLLTSTRNCTRMVGFVVRIVTSPTCSCINCAGGSRATTSYTEIQRIRGSWRPARTTHRGDTPPVHITSRCCDYLLRQGETWPSGLVGYLPPEAPRPGCRKPHLEFPLSVIRCSPERTKRPGSYTQSFVRRPSDRVGGTVRCSSRNSVSFAQVMR